MRKWLAYICIAIFSFQILPVKEIGKILFKGQITEEEVHGYTSDEGTPIKIKKEGDPFNYNEYAQSFGRMEVLTRKISTAIHSSDNLPDYHIPDILTPPPNC